MLPALPLKPSRAHLSRLMRIWRSAGWPSHDAIEIDLLAAQWVTLEPQANGAPLLRLSPAGIQLLASSRQQNQRAASAHDQLAEQMARRLQQDGRIVWHELSLRAQLSSKEEAAPGPQQCWLTQKSAAPDENADIAPGRHTWRVARPDLFSVRNTSQAKYLQPQVHEIKVSRADLLSDLRHEAKRECYQWLSSEVFYVFPVGIAEPEELPPEFGVWLLHSAGSTGDTAAGTRLELVRPARPVNRAKPSNSQAHELPFPVWLALAKATPLRSDDAPAAQTELGAPDDSP
ncbi:hypothetical protein [Roseateles sp. PN1]|uniref:hypothetical protein n=1 Tax=Roseateles sp. PN1 TaxID=3137372 RepID=UPI003138821E